MKKFLATLFGVLFCFVFFTACGENKGDKGDNPGGTPGEETGGNEAGGGETGGDETDNEPFWKEDGALKILMIGNSFTDNTALYTWDVAKKAGVENVTIGNLNIGGSMLDQHLENAMNNAADYTFWRKSAAGAWIANHGELENTTLEEGLTAENWDVVTLQQGSYQSDRIESYATLQALMNYVMDLAPQAKLYWNMTWTYKEGSTQLNTTERGDQMDMYDGIVSVTKSKIVPNPDFAGIVPLGTAIQNARSSKYGDEFTVDDRHLNDFGKIIAATTFIHAITELPLPNDLYVPSEIDADMKAVVREAVQNALEHPFEVTQSLLVS